MATTTKKKPAGRWQPGGDRSKASMDASAVIQRQAVELVAAVERGEVSVSAAASVAVAPTVQSRGAFGKSAYTSAYTEPQSKKANPEGLA